MHHSRCQGGAFLNIKVKTKETRKGKKGGKKHNRSIRMLFVAVLTSQGIKDYLWAFGKSYQVIFSRARSSACVPLEKIIMLSKSHFRKSCLPSAAYRTQRYFKFDVKNHKNKLEVVFDIHEVGRTVQHVGVDSRPTGNGFDHVEHVRFHVHVHQPTWSHPWITVSGFG